MSDDEGDIAGLPTEKEEGDGDGQGTHHFPGVGREDGEEDFGEVNIQPRDFSVLLKDLFEPTVPSNRPWEPPWPKVKDYTMCFFGKRRTGKTTAVEWLLRMCTELQIFDHVFVFTKTGINGTWAQHLPYAKIFDGFPEDVVEKIMQCQKKRLRQNAVAGRMGDSGNMTNPYVLLILDDMASEDELIRNKTLNRLLMNGRHHCIATWLTTQYVKKVGPAVRANVDTVITFVQHQYTQAEALFLDFSFFASKDQFFALLSQCTKDYNFIAMDAANPHAEASDIYFVGRAPPEKMVFWAGAPTTWQRDPRWETWITTAKFDIPETNFLFNDKHFDYVDPNA